jgi:hypothetical protein
MAANLRVSRSSIHFERYGGDSVERETDAMALSKTRCVTSSATRSAPTKLQNSWRMVQP